MGYQFCLFHELSQKKGNKWIVLNFDDAYHSAYTKAYPVLSRYGIRAHVCITGESISKPERENQLSLINLDEALHLKRGGWDFINHTLSHRILIRQDSAVLSEEITGASTRFRESGLPLNPDYFCLPEGKSDKGSEDFLYRCGYLNILTTQEGIWDTYPGPGLVPRINIASQSLLYALYKIIFKYHHARKFHGTHPASEGSFGDSILISNGDRNSKVTPSR
jgi:peptidoglycan/xylan/chitin deacetylase (PgdA/CDA1 family)